MFEHEDSRRKLIEWGDGKWTVAKHLVAKAGCIVGDHHHEKKDEAFLLASGRASLVEIGWEKRRNVDAPAEWIIPRGTYHRFELDEGSVLLGLASAAFDPTDEIKRQ